MRELGASTTADDVLRGVDPAGGNDGVRPYAVDPERAARLWAASEALVGERFP